MLRFDDKQHLVTLSVHDLIDAGPSSGDLRMQVAWTARTRMRIGQEVHTLWQDQRTAEDATFRREVRVDHRLVVRGWEVRISGRVDGLSQGGDRLLIEEVKSSTLPASRLAFSTWQDFPAYSRQLQLYLHFLHVQGQAVSGELVLISVADGSEVRLDVPLDPQLDDYIQQQLDHAILAHEERQAWLSLRRAAAAKGLPFPHDDWRPGQQDLATQVEASLRQGRTLLLSAPTGYGKTAAALHAALTVAYAQDRRVFFATARTTQQRMAEEVVSELSRRGMPIRAVSIRAKEKMCLNGVVICRPDACPYADGYHDKMISLDVRRRAWERPGSGCAPGVPRPVAIVDLAEQAKVCPFAMTLELSAQADVVIGDFNYVFDPGVSLEDITGRPGEWILVVDEAHNLPDRAMGYGSPFLSARQAETAAVVLEHQPGYRPFAEVMQDITEALREGVSAVPLDARDGELALPLAEGISAEWIRDMCDQMDDIALDYALLKLERPCFPPGAKDPWLETAYALQRFKSALERAGEETVALWRRGFLDRSPRRTPPRRSRMTLAGQLDLMREQAPETQTQDGGTGLSLLCRDPAKVLGPVFRKVAGAVCMSATLSPPDFYRVMLGLEEEDADIAEFPSPFPPERRQVLIAPQVSTEYRHRERDRAATARLISEAVAVVPGNVAVFFPSFAFREELLPLLALGSRPVLLQQRSMDEADREAMLQELGSGAGHVLLAVLGGIFAEGVDLPGAALLAAVVVGPALPQANLSRRLMQDWYQERYGQGFRYAWLVPGMARVIQAAGRVIRTPEDVGSIVLIGQRFLQRDYQEFFPPDWTPERTRELAASLQGFWQLRVPTLLAREDDAPAVTGS